MPEGSFASTLARRPNMNPDLQGKGCIHFAALRGSRTSKSMESEGSKPDHTLRIFHLAYLSSALQPSEAFIVPRSPRDKHWCY